MTPRDLSDVRAHLPAAGLDSEERLTEAHERLKDEVTEFAPTEQAQDPEGGGAEVLDPSR